MLVELIVPLTSSVVVGLDVPTPNNDITKALLRIFVFPLTSSHSLGVDVLIPTLPPSAIRMASVASSKKSAMG